mmetsp:Transcript_52425/g.121900  ORF Transcript_52425/g.121900 Transcript_52425/m.121900 type:complete len:363 (+) Transcript_52425:82-1170(+)|eukprot:CAMPEP_0171109264 /NCGR_PEP_ID=MMETSP0766_2-20121228/70653_1 /TAXON_ID=439317 /ORGANISM="Gambierdiscus australes, Strain CAWD 149" /LENGTH=362 /DNA_ID=CAMNT_0011570983 /DNA_START=63 /DNA_END=1151 /DNA_ORIENTATION=+
MAGTRELQVSEEDVLIRGAQPATPMQWVRGAGTRMTAVRAAAAAGVMLVAVVGTVLLARPPSSSKPSKDRSGSLGAGHSMSAVAVTDTVYEGHHIVSVTKKLCMTRSNDNKGSFVSTATCNVRDEHQKWVYKRTEGKILTPQGQCMDDGGDFVHIWDCSIDGPIRENQHWIVNEGKYIVNARDEKLCLHAVSNAKVDFVPCDGSPDLEWKIAMGPDSDGVHSMDNVPTQPPLQGKQLIRQGGFCLDGSEGQLHVWSCADVGPFIIWEQVPHTMQLKNQNGYCLDASSVTLQEICNEDSKSQQWNMNQQTGHLYNTNGGFRCLAAPLPVHNDEVVRLKDCDPLSLDLKWKLQAPVQPYWEEQV